MHFDKNRFSRAGLLLASVMVLSMLPGCSTQKNSWVNRTYHAINAKYNGFFNARESYKEGVLRLSELHTDNYDQILSVFRYGDEQNANAIRGNMDVTYEKASLVIRRHSMNIRGEEYNKWIDESYFLIARSHFFKRDYTLAILTFEYIIRQYDTERSHDSKVWIAKAYNQQERYEQALRMLELLENNYREGSLEDQTVALFRKAYADYFIRQGNYMRAAAELEKGIAYEGNRRERSRLTFIQAQLYHHAGQYAQAQQTYQKVLEIRPDAAMAFQARIGMALAYDPSVGGSGFIRRELNDMLSEERNRRYYDQVYYALAQLYMRENNEAEAIKMYEKSVEASDGNSIQKGLSFLRLGEIFFEHPDYQKANLFYDSATTFLPRSYDNYDEIRARQQILSGLAQLSRVIAREDSLQRLAMLSPEQQIAAVDALIADLREQEALRAEAERERMQAMREAGQTARQTRGATGGDRAWYFYNPTAVSNGQMEFFSRFGERPLEDLWRISNKQMMAGDFGMDLPDYDDMETEEDTLELDEYDRDTYLRNIPNTEEQMEGSKNRQIEAYYNTAMIFRDQLRDFGNAISILETLLNDFPGSERELPALYHLYYLHRGKNNHTAAETVKNKLLNLYPDSEYAKIIGDPDYAENVRKRHDLAGELYRESYEAFFSGRYDVISRNRQAIDTLEVSHELRARFAYLHAMALGKSDEQELFRTELKYIIDAYEDTPVHGPASILLASLQSADAGTGASYPEEASTARRRDRAPIDTPFAFSPDAAHFFVFVVNTREIDPAGLNGAVTAFNDKAYAESNLSVSNVYYQENQHLITVTSFQGIDEGMQYYESLMQSENLETFIDEYIESFIISVDNYPLFYQEKQLGAYRHFFDYYYMDI